MDLSRKGRRRLMDKFHDRSSVVPGQFYPAPYDYQWASVARMEESPCPMASLRTSRTKDTLIILWMEEDRRIYASDIGFKLWWTDDELLTNDQMIKAKGNMHQLYFDAIDSLQNLLRSICEVMECHPQPLYMWTDDWDTHDKVGKQFLQDCVCYCYSHMVNIQGIDPDRNRNQNNRRRNNYNRNNNWK